MNEDFEEGKVLIEIVQKVVDGRVGVDVRFEVDDIDIGTLIDLGQYFTNLGRNQRIRTRPEEEVDAESNGRKKRPIKPKPVRE